MLAFISDLHFVDETAGKHNIETSAFDHFFNTVKARIDRANLDGQKVNELKIVLLGDIFDLLRTEAWFEVAEKDRPWGDDTGAMRSKAHEILLKIKEKNSDTFKLFEPDALKKRFGKTKVECIYIPGNHDRLCATVDSLRGEVAGILGLDPGNNENFSHHFQCVEHGVYAMHGHAFDKYNYEGGPGRTGEDYGLVPIGDPITTELVARLPYQLLKNVEASGRMDAEDMEHLRRNFEEIENVRPFSATLKWLLYEVHVHRRIKDIIEDTVDEVVKEFNKLEYVKKWYERHDRWTNPLDMADRIQGVLFFLEKFKLFPAEKLMDIAEKVAGLFAKDELIDGATALFTGLDNRIQYIVMGHTHDPLQVAIDRGRGGDNEYERVYLNTGTWRKRYHESWTGGGFIGWKDMTYCIFYRPEEKPDRRGLPVFDCWSGALKREE